MPNDYLHTPTPIALITVDTWKIWRLELTFPDVRDGVRSARVWVQAGKRQDDGSVGWHQTSEHVVAGPSLEAALDSSPVGSTVYEAAARAVYGLCQMLGYIPADATQEGT